MSAQPNETDPYEPGVAQPTVDILPAAVARRGRGPLDPPLAPEPPVDQAWAPVPPGAVNPWTGAPVPSAPAYESSVVPPELAPPAAAPPMSAAPEQRADARRFLGMQLRRGRRADGEPQSDLVPPVPPQAPIAAWPTDLGGAVLADAEPGAPWGAPVPAPEASAAPEPLPSVDVAPVDAPPVQAPAEAVVDTPALAPAPVLAPAPSAEDEQVRALKALLQTSEAQRAAAENRADQAVAYAQQTQAELHQREAAFAAQVQALEARARTLANEAQDWQIRHREAETQVTELAQSVASTEARFGELRTERDELLAALEEATSPDVSARAAEPAEQA
jgi:hypothetical protein